MSDLPLEKRDWVNIQQKKGGQIMTELSAADIKAVTDGNHTGYGYGDCMGGGYWIWIILLFFLYGNNGFGNRGYGAELQQGFDNQSVMRKLDGITNGLSDGFYAMNTNFLQGQNQMARDLCQGFAAVNSGISENRFTSQQCCCETNRNIDAVRYENAKNTCEIVRAIEKDGQETRALINANVTQALRDKIVEKDQQLQTANFQLSQQAQTAGLVHTLRPFPQPAYVTSNPYQGINTCGCGNFI